MLRVLRSIIDFHSPNIKQENLQKNFLTLYQSSLKFESDIELQIYDFVREFYFDDSEEQGGEVPTIETIKDYFLNENEQAVLDKLKEVAQAKVYIRTNFTRLLEELIKKQKSENFVNLVRTAAQINNGKKKIDGKTLTGTEEAARFFIQNCDTFVSSPLGKKLKMDVRSSNAKNAFLERYQAIKRDPTMGMGMLTGLHKVDYASRGLRRGELMLVAGFSGNMKTTLSLNYAYNVAIRFGFNVYYITLEMSEEQVQRIIYCIHAEHPQFKLNPKYAEFYRKLPYNAIRDGLLSKDQEKFLSIVLSDFEKNPSYGRFILEKPATDITTADIQAKAEMENKQLEGGLNLLLVDEARLVSPRRQYRSTTESMNEVLKDLKQLALKFNGGEGLAVVSPFQTNRQGYREAEKNDGEYKQDSLAWANEAERSSDVIIYTYLDPELRRAKEIKIGNLKNRDNEIFESFNARVIGESRKIDNLDIMEVSDDIEETEENTE